MMGNIYDNLLQFKGIWRNYQDRVLANSPKYLADRKLHIVAAPEGRKTLLRARTRSFVNKNQSVLKGRKVAKGKYE